MISTTNFIKARGPVYYRVGKLRARDHLFELVTTTVGILSGVDGKGVPSVIETSSWDEAAPGGCGVPVSS